MSGLTCTQCDRQTDRQPDWDGMSISHKIKLASGWLCDACIDDLALERDGACGWCSGTGKVADCVTDYECVDPEEGCDLCMRRCDHCRPTLPAEGAA